MKNSRNFTGFQTKISQHEYAPKVDIMKGLTEAQKQEEEENVAALPEEKRRGHHGKTN